MHTDLSTGLRRLRAQRIHGLTRIEHEDAVVVETPVALLYNGLSFAVMMATPSDLEDFALGFALSEGVVASPDEFRLVDIVRSDAGVALHGAIPQTRYDALEHRRRNLEGRSGCGLCGIESLRDAVRPVPTVSAGVRVSTTRIRSALVALGGQQPLNALSGGVHAAGFVHSDGLLVREDVGRHNALDKLIGAMARSTASIDRSRGFLVITSRASYEIVHKAASAGIAAVIAISAPTDLAIRIAEQAGITLVAFARGETINVYTRPERIVTERE